MLLMQLKIWCWLSGSGAGLGSEGPKLKSCLAVELIQDGVDSACHPSEVVEMRTSVAAKKATHEGKAYQRID